MSCSYQNALLRANASAVLPLATSNDLGSVPRNVHSGLTVPHERSSERTQECPWLLVQWQACI